jgi:DNA-binding CsgD family transcriptional regulator
MHSISIVEFKHNSCETFLFATTPDNPQSINYLSNHREILYHFILYLKDRGKSIFEKAAKNTILIPGAGWETQPQSLPSVQDIASIHQLNEQKSVFFAQTPIYQFSFENKEHQNIKFSQREIMCIVHLLNYKTAVETAKIMNISPRTAESYLNNIKLKLNCTTRSELIKKLQNSPYWSAIL